MAVVPHRASSLVNFRAQPARITRLAAAVAGLATQPCGRFSIAGFAGYVLLLPAAMNRDSGIARLKGMLDLNRLRSQLLSRRVGQVHLQPFPQNPARSLRHVYK